jgi:hypothetical protein
MVAIPYLLFYILQIWISIIMEVFFLGKSNYCRDFVDRAVYLYQKKTHYIIALRPLLLHL